MDDSGNEMLGPGPIEGNIGFGFNDADFSDRVLRLEIIQALASNNNPGVEKDDFSDHDTGLIVKTLNICSLILAAKSSFFYKLLKNGMRESQNKDDVVILRINASEEAAFMDMLRFVYGKPLNATSRAELLDLLMAADKFEVTTCIRHCIDLLLELPMSLEWALLYLELPSSAFVGEVVLQPLLAAAKQYIASHFRHLTNSCQEAALALPLSAVKVVLASDGLKVDSEESVLSFIVNWGRRHYPEPEERREILTNHLLRYVCFPYMSCFWLQEFMNCPDFHYEQFSELVMNAFASKVEAPYVRHLPTSKDLSTGECGFPRRVYKVRLIKVVSFEYSRPCCVVYLDLMKEDFEDLFSSKRFYSQPFRLSERCFHLLAQCQPKPENPVDHFFGLYLEMEEDSESCTLDYEFAVRKKPSKEFQIQSRIDRHPFTGVTNSCRQERLFNWSDLMSDESEYIIDGILHLRAQIIISK